MQAHDAAIRVLALPRYGKLGPTGRLRFLQLIEHLNATGGPRFNIEFAPLLDDAYLSMRYETGRHHWRRLIKGYWQRLLLILRARNYDVLWLEKELFPGLPALAERLIARLGLPIIVDFDDATYHWYLVHPSAVVRGTLGRKIDVVARCAGTAVVGNSMLAEWGTRAGARKVVELPTPVLTSRYDGARLRPSSGTLTIGWIGTPSSASHLDLWRTSLQSLLALRIAKLVLIGAPRHVLSGLQTSFIDWSEDAERQQLPQWDIAIAPLADGPWERGKCHYRALQCMGAGLPVVASPVGVIPKIITDGITGLIAATDAEAGACLKKLAAEPELRATIGRAARRHVVENYSVAALAGTFRQTLMSAARRDCDLPIERHAGPGH